MIQIKNITITTILVIILMGDDDAAIDEKSLSTNDKEEQSLGKNENCFSSLAQWLTHPWHLHCSPEITDTELQLDTDACSAEHCTRPQLHTQVQICPVTKKLKN